MPSWMIADMGANLQKMWQEMGEVEEAGKEREVKEKEGMKKIKLKDRLRTRILRGDPRYTPLQTTQHIVTARSD